MKRFIVVSETEVKSMKLTEEINQALTLINQEDHSVMEGLKEALMDGVGPLFDEPGKKFFPLRPSSCLKPMRDLFYDLKNYYNPGSIPKEDFDARVKIIFQFGHLTETLLAKICKQSFEVSFEQEKVCYGTLTEANGNILRLTGAIDWAMMYGGSLVLVDSKSIGSYSFKKAPKEDHIAQLQLYMHSDWGRANNVDKALLIYFNKDNCEIKCIEFAYDAKLAQKILDRLTAVFDYYKRDVVPPREYLAGLDWQANYSSYKDYDNQEFMDDARELIQFNELYEPSSNYDKDELRQFVAKFGNSIIRYVDKVVFVQYSNGKLTLTKQERK